MASAWPRAASATSKADIRSTSLFISAFIVVLVPAVTLTGCLKRSRPMYSTSIEAVPAGTPLNVKRPSWSLTSDAVVPTARTIAPWSERPLPESETRPVIVPVPGAWPNINAVPKRKAKTSGIVQRLGGCTVDLFIGLQVGLYKNHRWSARMLLRVDEAAAQSFAHRFGAV